MNFLFRLQADEINNTIKLLTADDIKSMFNKFLSWLASFAGALVIALIIWFVGKKVIKSLIKVVSKILKRTGLDEGVIKFLCSLIRFAAYAVLTIAVIDVLGFQTSSLLAVVGSAGLALGLALQGSLSNFAGGILILIFKPFVVGDYIVTGAHEGSVAAIDLLYTKLLMADNKTVMLPNGNLSNSNIINVGAQDTRRLDIAIGVGYDSNVKKAKKLLRDILDNQAHVLSDQEIIVIVKSLDDSCVTLETRVWVNTMDYWEVRWELLEKYKEVFDSHGIEIPFNQLDIKIKE